MSDPLGNQRRFGEVPPSARDEHEETTTSTSDDEATGKELEVFFGVRTTSGPVYDDGHVGTGGGSGGGSGGARAAALAAPGTGQTAVPTGAAPEPTTPSPPEGSTNVRSVRLRLWRRELEFYAGVRIVPVLPRRR